MDCPITIPLAVLHAILAPETHLEATAPLFDADLDALINRLAWVESRGDDYARNSGEGALGRWQIRRVCLEDVNRLMGARRLPYPQGQGGAAKAAWHPSDRCVRAWARRMLCVYLAHYGTHWVQAGHGVWRGDPVPAGTVPAEVLARMWNGGPTGWQKAATEAYWAKVRDANPEDVARSANRARGKVWGAVR